MTPDNHPPVAVPMVPSPFPRRADDRIAALEAELARVKGELAEFGKVMVRVEHNGDGDTQELPATPESLLAYVKELQGEWDAAEKRAGAMNRENGELRAALKPFAEMHLYYDEEYGHFGPCTVGEMFLNYFDSRRSAKVVDARRAAALLARTPA